MPKRYQDIDDRLSEADKLVTIVRKIKIILLHIKRSEKRIDKIHDGEEISRELANLYSQSVVFIDRIINKETNDSPILYKEHNEEEIDEIISRIIHANLYYGGEND
jgi:hypothetical protein